MNGKHECRECGAVCVNTAEFAEWLRHNFKPIPGSWKYPNLGTLKMSEDSGKLGCLLVFFVVALVYGAILWAVS